MVDWASWTPEKHIPTPLPRAFFFSVIGLSHAHIYQMTQSLLEAGATLLWVYDQNGAKTADFCKRFPQATAAQSEEQVLCDPRTELIASAAVSCERGGLGVRAMEHGKDFFTDKPPFTALEQLEAVRHCVQATGRTYWVYFSERLQNESAMAALQLIQQGAIGKVLQVIGLGPHRLNAAFREPWFFDKTKYGGILCDIGSHQIEQYLTYTGEPGAEVTAARACNFAHPEYPALEDFGECSLKGANGSSFYFRVDWFTPDGLPTWGDGRTVILGTEGTIELRKYIDVAREAAGNQLYLTNGSTCHRFALDGKVGYPFFSAMLRDCIARTETAMTQAHIFTVSRLVLEAQRLADTQSSFENGVSSI